MWCADPMGRWRKLDWGGLQRARRLVLDGRDMHRFSGDWRESDAAQRQRVYGRLWALDSS